MQWRRSRQGFPTSQPGPRSFLLGIYNNFDYLKQRPYNNWVLIRLIVVRDVDSRVNLMVIITNEYITIPTNETPRAPVGALVDIVQETVPWSRVSHDTEFLKLRLIQPPRQNLPPGHQTSGWSAPRGTSVQRQPKLFIPGGASARFGRMGWSKSGGGRVEILLIILGVFGQYLGLVFFRILGYLLVLR